MIISMDIKQNTFTLVDVVKIVAAFVFGAIAWATLSIAVSNTRDDVSEIRGTQIENTKKQDIRWETLGVELNHIRQEQNQIRIEQVIMKEQIKSLQGK